MAEENETTKSAPIKVHHLRPAPGAHKAKIRVGRGEGGKRGKTAGRGTKGQHARNTVRMGFEGGQTPLQQRLPKLKGFKNRFATSYQVINLDRLAELFPEGGTVGISDMVERGGVRKNQLVKVLGTGDLGGVKLDITADAFSGSAQEKITAAGGSVTSL